MVKLLLFLSALVSCLFQGLFFSSQSYISFFTLNLVGPDERIIDLNIVFSLKHVYLQYHPIFLARNALISAGKIIKHKLFPFYTVTN